MENKNMMELVRELRARTYLGLTECKKALEESQGDIEKAIESLQKKGLKKVDDLVVSTEGVVRAALINNILFHGDGFIVEINCQTDFGARSEVFQNFVSSYSSDPNVTQSMLVQQLNLVSNQLGEKVSIRRFEWYAKSENSIIVAYNHMDKIAVLLEATVVESTSTDSKEKTAIILDVLENLAMQIAANKPVALNRETLPTEIVQKKQAFYEDEVKFKPEQVRGKILAGKMDKWYSEVALTEQDVIFFPEGAKKEKVSEYLKRVAPEITLIKFVRYEKSETIV